MVCSVFFGGLLDCILDACIAMDYVWIDGNLGGAVSFISVSFVCCDCFVFLFFFF